MKTTKLLEYISDIRKCYKVLSFTAKPLRSQYYLMLKAEG